MQLPACTLHAGMTARLGTPRTPNARRPVAKLWVSELHFVRSEETGHSIANVFTSRLGIRTRAYAGSVPVALGLFFGIIQ